MIVHGPTYSKNPEILVLYDALRGSDLNAVPQATKRSDQMKRLEIDWNHKTLASHAARLIPSPRSKPELTATTAVLSVLGAVEEFGHRFMRRVGGPGYANLRRYYRSYCEVPAKTLQLAGGIDGKSLLDTTPTWGSHDRPDGVIVVSRNKDWRALVEVKTGSDELGSEQVGAYHRMAVELGFDAVITISNEVGSRNGEPPSSALKEIRPAQLKKIPVWHVQWRDLLADGLALHAKHLEDNVADEDQDWILGEWLRYVHDDRSEILIPAKLGAGWNDVLQLAKKRLLQEDSPELKDVVEHWGDLAREVEFQMRINGVKLEPRISRKEKDDPSLRHASLRREATTERTLSHSWKFPTPVDTFNCSVDLDARLVRFFFEVNSVTGKSAAARVMCWASQIETKLATEVVVRPKWKKPSIETPVLLSECTGVKPLNDYLKSKGIDISNGMPTRIGFEWHKSLQGKAGRGGQTHLAQICEGVHEFYSEVMAGLRSVDVLPRESSRRSSSSAESMTPEVFGKKTSTSDQASVSHPEASHEPRVESGETDP